MTGNINANFNYNANFGPVINQMRQLMTQANYLNQTLQNFDKQASGLKFSLGDSLASDIGKMGGWNTKVMELSDSVGQFGKALQKQELSLKQYAREGVGALTKGSNAHKLAVREVAREMSQLAVLGEKNGKQMGMMITPQNINLKDFNTNLAVSRKQFDIFNTIVQDGATKLINFGKNTQWAGRQITVGLSVPIVSFGAQASKIFREVNVELTRFQKVYGAGLMSSGDAATIKMTENVKQLGIEFAKTMGIAVKDTAALAADLAATGIEGQKLLNAVRETTRLATLGDVSNQDAMKTTLSLQNAFKVSSDELAHSVDFLNAVENQTSLSLADLTTAIPKAGPVIKALGGDVKDLSLLMVALKEGGISAAEGANAIKSGMASLINPTKRATDVARQYGIDINQIVQANRGQLMPTIIEFQKQLSLLDDFGKAKVIENVFGKYQFARISALFDNLNASSSQTMQVMDLMGASQKDLAANSYIEMDTLMNSGAKRFQRATESIKAQFISIGGSITTAITPIIENVSSKIGKVIKFFEKLPAPVKSFLKVAAGLAVIAGPIIMVAGVFSNFLGYVTKGAMSMVNLGRRMSGIPVEKFKMLDDTQLMAQKSTDALSQAFNLQKTSVEQLNSVLSVYKKHLGDAITLNPNFVNTQVASQTTTGKPPVAKFQTGGSAWVPGSGDGDKVPAMLEPGEYVVNKKAASKHSGMLDDINFNKAPRFQSGGRINGYAGQSFGHGNFTPEDLQIALRSWISPMMTGLRPFNNPTKTGGIQPLGEQYPGFFADIFNQSMSPQENQHLMRAMQFDRKGGNMSPVAGTIMDSILRAQEGKQSSPRLEYGNAPFSHNTTRFTSFSTVQEAEFYKRFMTMFEKPKNKRSAESRARKTESGEIFPYLLDLFTGKGNGINGIPVSDLFQGQTQYGNEGEVVLPGGLNFPITGYGSDIKSRMLMLHSVMPGATKTINGKEVPVFQSGGRVNNYADKSVSPELLSLIGTWQQSTQYLREDPERLQKFMSYFQPSSSAMTLRRKTSLGLPGEIPNEQQLEILKALESGDFLSLAGKKIGFNGSPQSYSEHPLDWLVGKQFSNPLSGREFIQEDLIKQQQRLTGFNFAADKYRENPNNPFVIEHFQKILGLSPTTPLTEDAVNRGRRQIEENIQGIKNKLQSQLPMGVEPKTAMIERSFGEGTSMLPISQISQSNEYMGERLQEREIATASTSGTLDSVSQMWAPPSSFRGGKKAYDEQKHLFPYVLNMKQTGGRIQSAEAGWTQKEIKKAYSQYTDTELQSHNFKGLGRGRSEKRRPDPDNEIWESNPLNTAFHILLPNAVGRSEEEKTQLNILRRYMSMFNITDPNQLDAGMQASLMEMFMVHGGNHRLGIDPSLIKTMGEYDRGSAQVEGPGTYFSSNLKTHDETWNNFSGSHKYTISKTREAFRKVARGKGYIEAYDENTGFHEPSKQLKQLVNSFSRTKSGKEGMARTGVHGPSFNKNHWIRDAASAAENSGPDSPFYKYLIEQGYQGIKWSPATMTNFNIGREGISLSPISNPSMNAIYDEDLDDYVKLKKQYPARIPDLSPVGYLKGGRVNNYAEQSKSLGMPQKYADKQAAIEQMLAFAHLEATTGRFAGMPVTDIGQRQSGMGGFSSAIPGVNGAYEINGQKFIVKGHDTLDSALIESRGTQLTRDMFGLTTPEQELIKFGHPQTGQQMFGVRSPFDSRFAKTSGQIAPDAFFKQALAAIIRGDADLQADNLYDGIVTDVGAGYVTDRASQPRALSGKKNDVATQARINFLMEKGGARRWFAEATAGLAGSMSPEQYEAGFLNAIAQAQANAGGAIGALQNLTPEEKAMYELLQGDLSAASKIDWKAIHAHHVGIKPEPVKPKSAPTEKALQKKAADAAERQQALDAGFPSWMQTGGRVNNYADKSLYEKQYKLNKLAFAHTVPYMNFGASRLLYPIGFDIPQTLNNELSKSSVKEMDLYEYINRPKSLNTMTALFNKIGTNADPKQIQSFVSNQLNKTDKKDMINDPELYKKTLNSKKIQSLIEDFKKQGEFSDVRTDLRAFGVDKAFDSLGYILEKDGSYSLNNPPAKLKGFPLPEKIYQRKKSAYTVFQTAAEGVGGTLAKTRDNTERRRADSPGTVIYPNVIEVALAKLFGATDELNGKKVTGISHLLDPENLQSGGRINNFADDSMVDRKHLWKKKASAPKQYESVLRTLPDWATRGAEAQAILAALKSAGIPNPDEKAGYYIQNVLAHLNPATTNDGEIYTKIWEAMNLMKDSQVYNTFLETVQSRKDIQSRGGLVAPHVVQGVMADSGLPQGVVIEELTKLSQGKHPNTRQGAMVMLALARMFPQTAKGRGIPIGVIAGMQERLKGDFYETLQSRELPAGLPTVKVTSYRPDGKTPQSRSGAVLPGTPTMPKIVYPSMAGGGNRISGTGATVNVSPEGKILSSTIDDMLVTSASGQPMAVSSRELLAVTPEGTIAGVTSPGDEARKKIVHPFGTSLIRGKNFRAGSAQDGMGPSDAVYEGNIAPGNMTNFAASMMGMVGVVGQLQFAFEQFTSDVSNGTTKAVAALELLSSGVELTASQFPQLESSLASFSKLSKVSASDRTNLAANIKKDQDRATQAGQRLEKMYVANGMSAADAQAKAQQVVEQKKAQSFEKNSAKYGLTAAEGEKALTSKAGLGRGAAGLGKLAGGASKVLGFMGGPVGQIALQASIMLINKSIEIYNKEMEKARQAGKAAFAEPTETAKLLGVQLKSLEDSTEKYAKAGKAMFGETGKGAYDKAFEKTIKSDYGDLISTLQDTQTEQEKVNQLTNAYTSLIQRGMDPKNAKEMTAEIARQSGTLTAFKRTEASLGKIKDSKGAMSAELETMKSQMTILEERRKMVTAGSGKDLGQGALSMVTGGLGAYVGSRSKGQLLRADTVNKAIFGNNQNSWWAHALTGTGIDRNPFVQVLGGWLADKKIKQQVASQLGATLKSAFSMAANDPTASSEAIRAIVSQFKNADWGSLSKELKDILKDKGFGDNSELTKFITSQTSDTTTAVLDGFGEASDLQKQQILEVVNTGLGAQLEKEIKNGKLDFNSDKVQKLIGKAAQIKAGVYIEAQVDLQLGDTKKQLEGLKDATQKVFEIAIEAKQKELEEEDKRHNAALANLDKEAEKINNKKNMLQENTDYYIKELQRESAAEDYYKGQRDTALGGLKALSTGDVFGFIGAQQTAASNADQYGRQESMQNIQDTADAEQKKLDNALKGIDDRKKAEDDRHQAEMDHINAEVDALRKKESQSVGKINEALSLIDKAMGMTYGDKGFGAAIKQANAAADAAGLSVKLNTKGLKVPAGTDKDTLKAFNSAKGELKDALGIMAGDTVDAVTILNNKARIAKNIFNEMGLDPATSEAYKDLFKILNKPLDPKLPDAIETFVYAKPAWATDLNGKDVTVTVTEPAETNTVRTDSTGKTINAPTTKPKEPGYYTADGVNVWHWDGKKFETFPYINQWIGHAKPLAKADGGSIYGAGTATSDSIPAMLSNGEYVVKASSVSKYGIPMMNAINAGTHQMMPKYANGGGAGMMSSSAPSMPAYASGGGVGAMPRTSVPNSPKYSVPSTPSMSPSNIASIAQYSGGGYSEGNTHSPNYNFNFNGAGMDMVMGHVNKAMGGTINNNSRGVYA